MADHTLQNDFLYKQCLWISHAYSIPFFFFFFSSGCPESTFFSNSSGDLSSPKPRGSLLYPDYTRCVWHISIPASNQHIKLTFNTFQLESCLDCQCDFVEILDVIGNIHTSLGKFCGSSLPGPFFSSKQALKVVFSSDHGNGFSGFTATYSSVLPGAGLFSALVFLCHAFHKVKKRHLFTNSAVLTGTSRFYSACY